MKTTNTNLLDYSNIDILDMCYFLNYKAELNSNEYLKKFNPLLISKVEMYEYIKFKTDNFILIKFNLVIDEIRSYVFDYMDFYKLEKVNGKFVNKYAKDYKVDFSIKYDEPYKYICRTLELNKGLMVNSQQIVEFIMIAEDLYKEHCESKPAPEPKNKPKLNQLQTKLSDIQRGKLFDLLVLHKFIPETDKEGFIWAFGGVNANYTSYSTEWLEPKAKNLAVYLIDKLCYNPTASTHFWAIGKRIFSNAKGMRSQKNVYLGNGKQNKPNDPARGKPKGYLLIDEIISEAQK